MSYEDSFRYSTDNSLINNQAQIQKRIRQIHDFSSKTKNFVEDYQNLESTK